MPKKSVKKSFKKSVKKSVQKSAKKYDKNLSKNPIRVYQGKKFLEDHSYQRIVSEKFFGQS